MSILRINIWSGPRNISTALMYSFAQRSDTTVVDEPLYAHYLTTTNADEYHPHAADTLASQAADYNDVLENIMLGPSDTPVLFFKQMTHHLVNMPWDFLKQMHNVILTRDPVDMLPSYATQVSQPTMLDVGYAEHIRLLDYLHSIGQNPCVIDSRRVLENPEKTLNRLCDHIGIPFETAMLSWPAGARPEDGAWAPAWYDSVHKSTGFSPYKPKTAPFPEKLKPLLAECQPLYEQLRAIAI